MLYYHLKMNTTTVTHTAALARLGNALADETRLRILLALRAGPTRPSQLARGLGVSKQVISNQLACLRGCWLVHAEAQGRMAWYTLADPVLGRTLTELFKLTLVIDADCCTPAGCTCG